MTTHPTDETPGMTPEAQRIAIAEARGWRFSPFVKNQDMKSEAINCWISPGGTDWQMTQLPDYLNDLNAMREAEKVLTDEQRDQYAAWVEAGVDNDEWIAQGRSLRGLDRQLCASTGDPHGTPNYGVLFHYITATAAQRAEAFLRTIGKWRETP